MWRFFLSLLFLAACSGGGGQSDELGAQYLIRAGERGVLVSEFRKAFNLTQPAYGFDLGSDPAQLTQARKRLLNQMVVELLMQLRADELGITVSEEEVEAQVAEIKRDYPDDTFEEVLLEEAVPFELWRERLKMRLLVDKLIAAELKDKMDVSPEEISAYYAEHYRTMPQEPGGGSEPGGASPVEAEAILQQLRRKKAEQAYGAWIEALKAKYPVQINTEVFRKLTASAEPGPDIPAASQ